MVNLFINKMPRKVSRNDRQKRSTILGRPKKKLPPKRTNYNVEASNMSHKKIRLSTSTSVERES